MKIKVEWKSPAPIDDALKFVPYPIDSLPKIIRDAVVSYQTYGQQPLPIIASSALANVSLACQSLANVARDHMLISPVSLYFLVAASSGERKSAADKTFGAGIREWQAKTRANLIYDAEQSQLEHKVWQHRKDGLLKQIRKLSLQGESSFIEEQQLYELAANEPKIILLPELFFEDVTQEALVAQLATGWPSSSLWSDEGGIVLSSHGMHSNVTKYIATLNRLWDGNSFITHRKTSKNLSVSNRRLTLSLMLQPAILEKMLIRNEGVMRQSGFLARSLIAYPPSAMGERSYKEPASSTPELDNFHQRIKDCLEQSLDLDTNGCNMLPTLHFSSTAKNTWVEFFNQTEQNLTKSNKWLCIQDFASKAAENVSRMAALLHLFTGVESSTIQQQSVEQAINIITWHLQEAKRILDPERGTTTNSDAKRILSWLQKKKIATITIRQIQQSGPTQVRDKDKLAKAIDLLVEHSYVYKTELDGKISLIINPQCMP